MNLKKTILTAYTRTAVPAVVGGIGSFASYVGFDVSDQTNLAVSTVVVAVGGFILLSAYYLAAKWLEEKWPWVGGFLGVPRKPNYEQVRDTVGNIVDDLPVHVLQDDDEDEPQEPESSVPAAADAPPEKPDEAQSSVDWDSRKHPRGPHGKFVKSR